MDNSSLERAKEIKDTLHGFDNTNRSLAQNQGFQKVNYNQLDVALKNELNRSQEKGQRLVDVCVIALIDHIQKETEKLEKEFEEL